MASPAYMTVEAERQKNISDGASSKESLGQHRQDNEVNRIKVLAYEETVSMPSDPLTGAATGTRVHHGLCITKAVDKTSAQFLQAMIGKEPLTKVVLSLNRSGDMGVSEDYFEIVLEGATVVKMRTYMHNCLDASHGHLTHLEEVHFSFTKITWNHKTAGVMFIDDWNAAAPAA